MRRGTPYESVKDRYRAVHCHGVTIWTSEEIVPEQPGGDIEIALKKHLLARDLVIKGAKLFVHSI